MTVDDAIFQRDRLLMASHRLILGGQRLLDLQAAGRVGASAVGRQVADYRRSQAMIKEHFAALGEIAMRGDAALH